MSESTIAWLHEPTGNVFKEGECQALIKVWQEQFGAEIAPEEIAADFVPLVRADASSQAEIERLKEVLTTFVAHYPMGLNPFLDDAYRAARAALSGSKE